MRIAGIIFTGGKASRLGGADKGAIDIDGTSSFARVAGAMGAADQMFAGVACDHDGSRYRGCPVIPDRPDLLKFEDRDPGVILSILSSLEFAASQGFDHIVTAPTDTPFLPVDYSARLLGRGPAVAVTGKHIHGLHAFLPVKSLEIVRNEIIENGLRRVSKIHEVLGSRRVEFTPWHMTNLNTPGDLKSLS